MEMKRFLRYPSNTGVSSRAPWVEDNDNAAPEGCKDQGPHRFGSAALIVNSRSRAAWSAAAVALDYLRLLDVPVNTTRILEDPTRLPGTVRSARWPAFWPRATPCWGFFPRVRRTISPGLLAYPSALRAYVDREPL